MGIFHIQHEAPRYLFAFEKFGVRRIEAMYQFSNDTWAIGFGFGSWSHVRFMGQFERQDCWNLNEVMKDFYKDFRNYFNKVWC